MGIRTGREFELARWWYRLCRRVIPRLRQIIATTKMTELALSMQLPGLDPRKVMRSLERFTNEVLPALRAG